MRDDDDRVLPLRFAIIYAAVLAALACAALYALYALYVKQCR